MPEAATTHPDVQSFVAGGGAEQLSAQELVGYLVETFAADLALACSFQKEESVLLDMLLTADPKARVFALDTHVLFSETYDVWRQIEKRYGIEIKAYSG